MTRAINSLLAERKSLDAKIINIQTRKAELDEKTKPLYVEREGIDAALHALGYTGESPAVSPAPEQPGGTNPDPDADINTEFMDRLKAKA